MAVERVDKRVTEILIYLVDSCRSTEKGLQFRIPQPKGRQWLSCIDLQEVSAQMLQGLGPDITNESTLRLFCSTEDTHEGKDLLTYVQKNDIMGDWYQALSKCIDGNNVLKLNATFIPSGKGPTSGVHF
jgi:hypothetical protein